MMSLDKASAKAHVEKSGDISHYKSINNEVKTGITATNNYTSGFLGGQNQYEFYNDAMNNIKLDGMTKYDEQINALTGPMLAKLLSAETEHAAYGYQAY
jgi:hypothetical protein